MTPRILGLSILDPRGEHGLAAAVRTAHVLGVEAIPVPTGILLDSGGKQPRLQKLRAGLVEDAVEAAIERPLDGMLIGLLPSYWQARALARVLSKRLPETMVYAPLSVTPGTRPWLGARNWTKQAATILPEATTVVLPSGAGAELLLGSADADPSATAAAVLDAGAHSAWLLGESISGRGVDFVAHGSQSGVLDYPTGPQQPLKVLPAALAALLAKGLPLVEAIERAHRFARGVGSPEYAAAVGR